MKNKSNLLKILEILTYLGFVSVFTAGCNGKFPGADARKVSADPAERVKKNLEEGRGITLNEVFGSQQGGKFDFASSNELWRASLDVIDFMPLTSVNYSGGIIVTDWYSDSNNPSESIKISIRFLTNEIRADALNIKVFYKKCTSAVSCKITEQDGNLKTELLKNILKQAAIYEKMNKDKDFKPYSGSLTNIK